MSFSILYRLVDICLFAKTLPAAFSLVFLKNSDIRGYYISSFNHPFLLDINYHRHISKVLRNLNFQCRYHNCVLFGRSNDLTRCNVNLKYESCHRCSREATKLGWMRQASMQMFVICLFSSRYYDEIIGILGYFNISRLFFLA